MAKADLHIHTLVSDGTMSPEMVVKEAARLNLAAISITDHDSTGAVAKAQQAAEVLSVDVIPGCEITSAFGNREAHLLAYDFKMEDPGLNKLLKSHQQARVKRARWIIGQLKKQGLDLDIDEVMAEANGQNVGRPHIAEILRKKGYIATKREAFIRYLSDQALGTIPNNYYDFKKVIEVVKSAGGVMVLAHPGRLYSKSDRRRFLDAGIDGIEALHPSHRYKMQKETEAFAQKHHLLITGGSDFHGAKNDYYRHFGTLGINKKRLGKLRSLAARRKKVSI